MTACRQRQQWAALYRSCLLSVPVKSDAIGGLIKCKRLVKCNANEWSVPMQSGGQVECDSADVVHLSAQRRGNGMKGRRKVKTHKWQKKSAVEAEARELLRSRSEKKGRLLDIAAKNVRELEPVGRLAGR